MTLTKHLWIAIFLLLVITLGGSFVINTLAAKNYLQEQLSLKNQDNVSALALSISQMEKDPASLEVVISAQFDSGHYQYIHLTDPSGNVLITRENPPLQLDVPAWFQELIPIRVEAGYATIQNGWNILGTLELQSHSRFAYQPLWQQTKRLFLWFLSGVFFSGIIGSYILKKITRPLDQVVLQAQAIGNRKFIRIDEPRILEFRKVVCAMNHLSGQIQETLEDEEQRLEKLRRAAHYDNITGLLNREQFINRLNAAAIRDDGEAAGSLVIARLSDLKELNKALGRNMADTLLEEIGTILNQLCDEHSGWVAGRLNGADFSLLASGRTEAHAIALRISEKIQHIFAQKQIGNDYTLPVGATVFEPGEDLPSILARTDHALTSAALKGPSAVEVVHKENYSISITNQVAWRQALSEALDKNMVSLGQYPVVDFSGQLLHMEAPARVLIDGDWCHAGLVIPSATSSGLLPKFDQCVTLKALESIRQDTTEEGVPQGVNLSHQTIGDPEFSRALCQALKDQPQLASQLWLEIPEYGVYRHLDKFKAFCNQLKPLGCKIGLEHVGGQLSRISQLHDLGLDYLKIDAALIRQINTSQPSQAILRNLCTLAHTIGLIVIAEGVQTSEEKDCLPGLGFDGVTGPFIKKMSR